MGRITNNSMSNMKQNMGYSSFYILFKPRDSLFFSFFPLWLESQMQVGSLVKYCIAQSKSGLKPLQHLQTQCVVPRGSSLWMVGLWSCSSRCNLHLQLLPVSLPIIFIFQFLSSFLLASVSHKNISLFPAYYQRQYPV